jgi:multidrug efflux system outer membrane protein
VAQARATVRVRAPDLLPDVNINANAARQRPSVDTTHSFGATPYNTYSTQAIISYEPDLFNRIRDASKADALDAQALMATYRSVLLALQADVAQNYFSIRALDEERRLMRETIMVRKKQAEIMNKRYAVGDVSAQDKAHANADLAQAEADLIALDRRRANLEHALAILLGKAPSDFALPQHPLRGAPPAIPAGIPSSVLRRAAPFVTAREGEGGRGSLPVGRPLTSSRLGRDGWTDDRGTRGFGVEPSAQRIHPTPADRRGDPGPPTSLGDRRRRRCRLVGPLGLSRQFVATVAV